MAVPLSRTELLLTHSLLDFSDTNDRGFGPTQADFLAVQLYRERISQRREAGNFNQPPRNKTQRGHTPRSVARCGNSFDSCGCTYLQTIECRIQNDFSENTRIEIAGQLVRTRLIFRGNLGDYPIDASSPPHLNARLPNSNLKYKTKKHHG